MDKRPRDGIRGLFANLLLSLVVSAVFLALLEGGARLFEGEPPARPEIADYLWDWEERWDGDFYTMRSAGIGWPPWEEFNGDGLRDRTHSVAKPAGTQRLVCLGDSVTLGDGIEASEAFPQVLQRQLDARGPGVEVLNVALWGWSTRQQRLAWERIARRYSPDAVILGVCLNDVPELQNNLAEPPRWLTWLFARSALVRRVVDAPGRELHSVEELFGQPPSPTVDEAFALFETELERLRDAVQGDGARLGVAVFPFRFQLEPGAPEPLAQRRIAEIAARLGLPLLDLLPELGGLGPSAFHDYDHLSVAGARHVAGVLADSPLVPPVIDVVGELGERDPVEVLGAAASDDESRLAAAWALSGGHRGEDLDALTRALGDSHEGVRTGAARALATRLGVADPEGGLPSLPPRGEAAVRALFAGLSDPSEPVRHACALALWSVVPRAEWTERLAEALGSADPFVRGFAAWSLGTLGERAAAAVPALVTALDRPEGFDRGGAATALGRMGAAAAAALPALAAGLDSEDPERRWKAARAVGRIAEGSGHAADVVEPLRRALGDPDERVREQAARALGRLGRAANPAAEDLATAARDPVASVREAAEDALRRISN